MEPVSERTVTATILSVEKIRGKFQHLVQTDHGGYRTALNSSLGFIIESYAPREYQNIWPIVTLTLRRSRRYEYIINIQGKNAIDIGIEQRTQNSVTY